MWNFWVNACMEESGGIQKFLMESLKEYAATKLEKKQLNNRGTPKWIPQWTNKNGGENQEGWLYLDDNEHVSLIPQNAHVMRCARWEDVWRFIKLWKSYTIKLETPLPILRLFHTKFFFKKFWKINWKSIKDFHAEKMADFFKNLFFLQRFFSE